MELIVDALLAIARSDRSEALRLVTEAGAVDSDALLPAALHRYLTEANSGEVYVDPAGFDAFIGGGNNPELYRQTIALLGERHASIRPASILDIGCGDGRVTAAVLADAVERVALLEPSDALLSVAQSAVGSVVGEERVTSINTVASSFFGGLDPSARWDLVQSTFAMHTLLPAERAGVLTAIAAHTNTFVMVDFDVPTVEDRGRDHATYVAERYEVGLSEYPDNDVVSQRFLMPVLVGQFDPTQTRHTFEQPADAWAHLAVDAGFTNVRVSAVFDYWWAPAFLLEATGR